ncbi:MAG: mechanosensitive ion channel family protein [Gloeocapsa sp. DLM2.Bin57]|nr:MAG: mechanosensitive ion channel family protein [Gloeocapsa sp. DLM2.Bin57]
MFNRIVSFILTIVITFTLVLSLHNSTQAQILPVNPGNGNNQEKVSSLPWWSLNRSFVCGRFWCSNIYIYNVNNFSPELTLAVPFTRDESTLQAQLEVESRSQLVQKTFSQVLSNLLQSQSRRDLIIPESNWRFWLPNFPKPEHPFTPQVEIGLQNNQTVIFVPTQPELSLTQQDLVTVTDIDARANGKSIEELASVWRNNLRYSMSQRLWGYTFNANYPGIRLVMLLAIAVVAILIICLITYLKSILKNWEKILKKEQDKLTNFLTKNYENLQQKTSELMVYNTPDVLFKKQSKIIQTRNIIQLFLRILFWIQFSILLLSLSLMTIVFADSRFFYRLFLGQAIFLPALWALISLGDKALAMIIQYYLNQWAMIAQKYNPLSNRYTLRVKTYSRALKSATGFLLNFLGLYLTTIFLGIDLSFYASAGAVAVVLAFLSRNLIESMLSGALILWYDSYAVGDIIEIEGNTGVVEDINLYATSLRNLSGELIVIPNRSINILINKTKDWSRVDFTIEINYDADSEKAMAILEQVAEELRQEPQWRERILESPEILGVDGLSHQGIIIRLLIKTAPKEQWNVEREFRLRVKQAFDEANINVGVPQYKIVQNIAKEMGKRE